MHQGPAGPCLTVVTALHMLSDAPRPRSLCTQCSCARASCSCDTVKNAAKSSAGSATRGTVEKEQSPRRHTIRGVVPGTPLSRCDVPIPIHDSPASCPNSATPPVLLHQLRRITAHVTLVLYGEMPQAPSPQPVFSRLFPPRAGGGTSPATEGGGSAVVAWWVLWCPAFALSLYVTATFFSFSWPSPPNTTPTPRPLCPYRLQLHYPPRRLGPFASAFYIARKPARPQPLSMTPPSAPSPVLASMDGVIVAEL